MEDSVERERKEGREGEERVEGLEKVEEEDDDQLFDGAETDDNEASDASDVELLESLLHSDSPEINKEENTNNSKEEENQVSIDAFSKLRIRNRRVTAERISAAFEEYKAVRLEDLKLSVLTSLEKTHKMKWATVGVVVKNQITKRRSLDKSRQEESSSVVLSDLKARQMTSVTVLAFGAGHRAVKNNVRVGQVVVLFGARLLPPKNSSKQSDQDAFVLVAKNEKNFTVLGDAADFGLCKGSDGGKLCKNVVNISKTEYCPEHFEKLFHKARNNRMGVGGGAVGSGQRVSGAFGTRVHKSTGTFSYQDPFSKYASKAQASATASKKKKGSLSAMEMLKQDATERDRAELLAWGDDRPETAIVTADGVVIKKKARPVDHFENRNKTAGRAKKNEVPQLSSKTKEIVNNIARQVEKGGASATSRSLSRGMQRMYAACTGFNIDASARLEGIRKNRELEQQLDPLAKKLFENKAKEQVTRFNTSASQFGIAAPPKRVVEEQKDKKLLETALQSVGPKFQRAATKARADKASMSIDMDLLRRNHRQADAVQKRAHEEYRLSALRHERENAENEAKKKAVAAKLKQQKTALSKQGISSSGITHKVSKLASGASLLASARTAGVTSKKRSANLLGESASNRSWDDVVSRASKKSKFASSALKENKARVHAHMENLMEVEQAAKKMEKVTSIKVRAWQCCECEIRTEKPRLKCQQEGHELAEINVKKFFFKCKNPQCKGKSFSLGKSTCTNVCQGCGGIRWEPCSAYSNRSMGIPTLPKDVTGTTHESENASTAFNRRGYN